MSKRVNDMVEDSAQADDLNNVRERRVGSQRHYESLPDGPIITPQGQTGPGNIQDENYPVKANGELSPVEEDAAYLNKARAKRLITATLLTSLVMVGFSIFNDSYSQWLYTRFQKQILGSNYSLINMSRHNNPCLKENNTVVFKKELDEAQQQASQFVSWTFIVSLVPAIFVNLLFGSYIDYIGRKLFFVVPTIGFFFHIMVTWAVCFWDLHLNLILIGYAIEGITGSLGTLSMALYIYAADNTNDKKSRSFGMVVVQTVIALLLSVTHLGVGYFISHEGYAWPLFTSCILIGLGSLGYIFLIEEHVQKSRLDTCFNPLDGAKRVFSFYMIKSENPLHRRKDYILLVITFFLFGTCLGVSIQTLYVMNEPFCWDPTKIGYVTTGQGVVQSIGPLLFMSFAQRHMGDDVICVIALVTSAAGKVVFAFAQNDWMVYLGFLLTILELSVLSIIRAILSRMVPLKYRGSIFSSIAVIELATFAASGSGLTTLYSVTESMWNGLTYCVISVCLFIAALLMVGYGVTIRRRISRPGSIEGDEERDGNKCNENHSRKDDERPLLA